ncbi:hypothetical protein F4818DRAFT_423331 [Hypoxylon cercidicola]|nr:hypothetical protein F4818DRAFT_423331 [Hypoxylon cercidicola]
MSVFASSSTPSPSTAPTPLSSSDPSQPSSTFEFTNPRDLFDLIDATSGDFLTITGVTPRDFADLDEQREVRGRGFRWRRYYAASQTLLVAIPTHAHEMLHCILYEKFRDKVPTIERNWRTKAATTFRAGRDRGEGDSTGGPIPQRRHHDQWPTLVIEAGASESLAQLRLDMQWWFAASNHEVKIVLLAKLDAGRRIITLEKWEEGPVAPRPGATTPRQAAALRPILQQTSTIHRNEEATNSISYDVTRGALVLEFGLLFLRSPREEEGEGDIIISASDLEWYAACVWD